jgi:two-component system KDP operon response regulator KdpE
MKQPPGTRVLVVEDDTDVRVCLAALLRHEGYDVSEVATGIAARELIRDEPPDVVILDLGLPLLNGTELLASLEDPPPVVVYSAFEYVDQDEVHRRFGDKVSAFLRKPIHPQVLLAAVADAAHSR